MTGNAVACIPGYPISTDATILTRNRQAFINVYNTNAQSLQPKIGRNDRSLVSQPSPVKPNEHRHVYPSSPSTHVPLLSQGNDAQSSMSKKKSKIHLRKTKLINKTHTRFASLSSVPSNATARKRVDFVYARPAIPAWSGDTLTNI